MDDFVRPIVTVDVVLLTLDAGALKVALHTRARAPFAGQLALPGGYVFADRDESVQATAYRTLKEKTGLAPRYLEQLCTMSGPARDPRGWSVSVAHVALIPIEELRAAGSGVFEFYPVDDLPQLAFDHREQILVAVQRVRNKSSYSTLPCWLLPEKFTLTQLQRVYEQVLGETMTRSTFRTRLGIKVAETQPGLPADGAGLLIATDEFMGGVQRPARLFRVDHLGLFRRAIW